MTYFQFEADFIASLRCIPMQVRFKLDTCGIKLKLAHWHQFKEEERHALVNLPCTSPEEIAAYRNFLQNLILNHTGLAAKELTVDKEPAWLNSQAIPATTIEKAQEFGVIITPKQWLYLTPLQRFALIKLSRPSHENRNFYPALKEFNLV